MELVVREGNFSVAENPLHTYVSAACSYTVSLTASDVGGSNTTSIVNYINVSAALPIPVFTGTPTSGDEPLSVQFNDTTPGTGIRYWNWSFGDATWFNTTDVTAKNVTHPYTAIGSYTVNLSVTNSSGIISPVTVTNTTSIANYINVSAALPIPVFTRDADIRLTSRRVSSSMTPRRDRHPVTGTGRSAMPPGSIRQP